METRCDSFDIVPFKSGYLSQWYKCNFTDPDDKYAEDHIFTSAEQYMMYNKASIFDDDDIADEILDTHNCRHIKKLGRKVKYFDEELWDEYKVDIVTRGNYLKFSQNEKLKEKLLDTGNATIVEASSYDKIWGVGIDVKDPRIYNPEFWRGQNLLGKCLMQVRYLIKNDENPPELDYHDSHLDIEPLDDSDIETSSED